MARRFFGNPRALLIGAQTDIATANPLSGDHHLFAAEYELPEPEYKQTEWKSGVLQPGAGNAPIPSTRSAKFKIKFPLHVGKVGYAVTDDPSVGGFVGPDFLALATALGSTTIGAPVPSNWVAQTGCGPIYTVPAAVIAGSTSTAVKLDGASPSSLTDSNITAGGFLACATDAADTSPQAGWVKSIVGVEPADITVTLYEAAANTAATGDRILGAVVAYLSNLQPNALTIKGFGGVTNGDFLLIGCYATDWEIDITAGDVWWVTLTYKAADYQDVSGASTMPSATGAWRLMPAANSANGGRFTYGASGTGSATNIEGWKSLKINGTSQIEFVTSLAGIQGLGTPAVSTPKVKVTAEIAWDSAMAVTDGETSLVTDWRNGTAFSLCCTVAKKAGQIVSIFLPALLHSKAPTAKASGEGGMVYMTIEAELGEYAGDGAGLTETAPANSLLRIAVA